MKIPENYFEKVYAGWLGKIIGIRLGAAIEGWTYEKINQVFGELTDYPVAFKDFAADDDSNGPIFFIRALEDCKDIKNLKAQDVGEALLNYASFEHGFFWWGGYGISTEHTAYLNLRNGIEAPRSGSVEQNGAATAEQIGGQIFIDTWGMTAPGNPDLAAKNAAEAASVTHGGNGVYGGVFIAVCVSLAFVENDINTIIEKALTYIPQDCEYAKVVHAVMAFHKENPADWRACYNFLFENYGYDKYPGSCHIIPNSGVIILALLYGNGDFTNSVNICNMCGWDTDCNVANVGSIIGTMNGISGIDYDKWRKPINDFLACSSVIGSLNNMDIPYGASYLAKLAYKLADEELPEAWAEIIAEKIDSCHFEYPGSTHAVRTRSHGDAYIVNSDEAAFSGTRSLKVTTSNVCAGDESFFYKKTYYVPADFHDDRYMPAFSPTLYPGQTVHVSAMMPDYSQKCTVQVYVKDGMSGELIRGEKVLCEANKWYALELNIPKSSGRIDEAGVIVSPDLDAGWGNICTVFIDDLYFSGTANYKIDCSKLNVENWPGIHNEISQFTNVKGLFYLEDGALHVACADFAEAYTGAYNWKDYSVTATLTPIVGEHHLLNFRVQGAIRSYAAGFFGNGKFALLKNHNGYKVIDQMSFDWKPNASYTIKAELVGAKINVYIDSKLILSCTDEDAPYLTGSIGVSTHHGSHCKFEEIVVL